jgi:hypothetical protein
MEKLLVGKISPNVTVGEDGLSGDSPSIVRGLRVDTSDECAESYAE